MGNVAAVRDNWRPLTVGGASNTGSISGSVPNSASGGGRDFLSEQRRQMAEVERMKNIGGTVGGGSTQTRNSKSQSVLPPSGAARPINHLEVNKMAQVNVNFSSKKTLLAIKLQEQFRKI